MQLLTEHDGNPVERVNTEGASPFLFVCEHASCKIPQRLGNLGLSDEALTAHIAWDPGALALSQTLSQTFDAAMIHQNFSRLVYDCNRPPESPDAMPEQSEIFAIPGNVAMDQQERAARVAEIYRPFEAALSAAIAARIAAGRATVLVTMHSFTPVYRGVSRSVEIGLLHDQDDRLANAMLDRAGDRYDVRRNQPYGPEDGVTHTLKLHGLENGLMNVMIEVRNDLLRDEAGQMAMAGFLSSLLGDSLAAMM